jgi:hypothetical protein
MALKKTAMVATFANAEILPLLHLKMKMVARPSSATSTATMALKGMRMVVMFVDVERILCATQSCA